MSIESQKTLAQMVRLKGVGIHSGVESHLTLVPAKEDVGLIFVTNDGSHIPALHSSILDTRACTTLGTKEGASVRTVEHLLAALAFVGIDNLYIHIQGPEVPIMDGSSAPFVFAMLSVGIVNQSMPKKYFVVTKTVEVRGNGGAYCRLSPNLQGFKGVFELNLDECYLSKASQKASYDQIAQDVSSSFIRARTFGFRKDLSALNNQGLALGANENNVIALQERSNNHLFRSHNELALHKLLDAFGDLRLLGHEVKGEFQGFQSNHTMNAQLIDEIKAQNAVEIMAP